MISEETLKLFFEMVKQADEAELVQLSIVLNGQLIGRGAMMWKVPIHWISAVDQRNEFAVISVSAGAETTEKALVMLADHFSTRKNREITLGMIKSIAVPVEYRL